MNYSKQENKVDHSELAECLHNRKTGIPENKKIHL